MVRLIGRGKEDFYFRAHVILVSNSLLPITTDSQLTLNEKTHVVLMHLAPLTRFSFLHAIRFFICPPSPLHTSPCFTPCSSHSSCDSEWSLGWSPQNGSKNRCGKAWPSVFRAWKHHAQTMTIAIHRSLKPYNPFTFSSIPSSHILLLPTTPLSSSLPLASQNPLQHPWSTPYFSPSFLCFCPLFPICHLRSPRSIPTLQTLPIHPDQRCNLSQAPPSQRSHTNRL